MTKKQKLAVVRRTREIIARPKGWMKGYFYQRKDGGTQDVTLGPGFVANSVDDFSFCLAGAARRAYLELVGPTTGIDEVRLMKALSVEALAAAKLGARGISYEDDDATFTFNDHHKTRKRDVIALLDEKIAELEGTGAEASVLDEVRYS